MRSMFVDSHCHLDFSEFSGRIPSILDAMAANRVSHALCAAVNLTDFPRILTLAERHPQLFASAGVHPDQASDTAVSVEDLVARAKHPRVLAIGETGLDYYRQTGDMGWQQERFRTHIRAAKICSKPLIVHTRNAGDDTLRILREEGADRAGGVMHCFTETLEFANAAMELGFYISFSGIVTFKNALELKAVAKSIPLQRMLIETDSPYLAPVPHRGKVNEPAWVRHVAEEIAALRGVPLETIADATTGNFRRLFRPALSVK